MASPAACSGRKAKSHGPLAAAVTDRDWIALYLEEDLGDGGDITSDPLFAPDERGVARVVARQPCFLAGVARAAEVFERLGGTSTLHMNDSSWIGSGAAVLTVEGPTRGILSAERTALNLLGRMSGVASETRRLVETLGAACSGAVVAGTRKTTPGMRVFEKEAIAIAGGDPHRMGLWDAAMVKDNHREAAGSMAEAVRAVRDAHPEKELTAEAESLEDAIAAAEAGADWILIDNQEPDTGRAWAETLWERFPELKLEASGGITPDNLVDYGWADRISLGALTTRAHTVDFGLDWGPAEGRGTGPKTGGPAS
jgi:nicotinate-nucleotide pyrophosphorylase (carboxylating)